MKQLFILLVLSITLGCTVGVPTPEIKEVEVMDLGSEPDDFIPNADEMAVSRCKY